MLVMGPCVRYDLIRIDLNRMVGCMMYYMANQVSIVEEAAARKKKA